MKQLSFENSPSIQAPSLTRQLLVVAIPIVATNLLQTLYNMVDTWFLGRLGAEALSAPSITMNISNFLIVFGTGFSIAGTTLISQTYGADRNNRERIDFLASQVFLINLVMSLVVVVLGTVLTGPLCSLLKVPAGLTYEYTYDYMSITFLGMPFMFVDMILRGTLQGMGNSVTPLIVQTFAVLLNVVLDPIFIFGLGPVPAMGVAGAAIATNIARFVSFSFGMYILLSGVKGLKVRAKYLKPDPGCYSLIFRIGFPAAIGQAFSSLGFAVIQGVVNGFGPAVIAAFGVGNKITSLFNMPAQGISQGVAVVSGRKLGENKPKEAEKVVRIGLLIIGVFITLGMGYCFFFGHTLMRFFVDDPAVIAYGVQFFHVVTVSVAFFALFTVICGAFQGGGVTRPVMIFNIVRLWGIRVPFSYLLPLAFGLGPLGIWIAMFMSNFIVSIWAFLLFGTGKWKQRIDMSRVGVSARQTSAAKPASVVAVNQPCRIEDVSVRGNTSENVFPER